MQRQVNLLYGEQELSEKDKKKMAKMAKFLKKVSQAASQQLCFFPHIHPQSRCAHALVLVGHACMHARKEEENQTQFLVYEWCADRSLK